MSEQEGSRGWPEWAVATVTLGTVAVIVAALYALFLYVMATAAD